MIERAKKLQKEYKALGKELEEFFQNKQNGQEDRWEAFKLWADMSNGKCDWIYEGFDTAMSEIKDEVPIFNSIRTSNITLYDRVIATRKHVLY